MGDEGGRPIYPTSSLASGKDGLTREPISKYREGPRAGELRGTRQRTSYTPSGPKGGKVLVVVGNRSRAHGRSLPMRTETSLARGLLGAEAQLGAAVAAPGRLALARHGGATLAEAEGSDL